MKAKQSAKLKGNQNAKKGKHDSVVLRLPVHIVDVLYECLQLDGELIEEDDEKLKEYALSILSDHARRKVEQSEATIL